MTSTPSQAVSDSNISGGSTLSMEEVYDTISSQKDVPAANEETALESPQRVHVPFIKAAGLRDVLQKCRQDAEKRVKTEPEE